VSLLEGLPQVVNKVSEACPGIEVLGYDFFTAQPVKSARAYYLRTVLHDWPDTQRDCAGREGNFALPYANGSCNDGNVLLYGKDDATVEDFIQRCRIEDSEHLHTSWSTTGGD
jgi:hypothetical protein